MRRDKRPFLPGNSPTELKADPGLPGKILSNVPEWMLREGEHREDCWEFLLGVGRLPVGCYDLFRAAVSLDRAVGKLGRMSIGIATLNCDMLPEIPRLQARGEKQKAERLAKKVHGRLLRVGLWPDQPRTGTKEAQQQELLAWKREEQRKRLKRYGREGLKPESLPTAEESQNDYLVENVMVWTWLRWGVFGEPGLCFYADEAMSDLLHILYQKGNCTPYDLDTRQPYYRKVRQRLGLEHAYPRSPKVISARR